MMDKKQIAFTALGIIAGLTLTYLLWKETQNSAAIQNTTEIPQNYTGGGSYADILPPITVPDITQTFGNPSQTSSDNNAYAAELAALQQQLEDALNAPTNGTTSAQPPQNQGTTSTPVTTTTSAAPDNNPPLIQYPGPPITVHANPPGSYPGSTYDTGVPPVTSNPVSGTETTPSPIVNPQPIPVVGGGGTGFHPIGGGNTGAGYNKVL